MEEKKRGRPAGKKLSADFYKKSAPQREDLALIAQGKIKLGADMDTPVKPEYDWVEYHFLTFSPFSHCPT